MERALQDILKVHRYGCGALNERGLQIKSFWMGEEVVCAWRPKPHHIGHPGILYGGMIASVVDCHCIWTASAHAHRRAGIEMDGPPCAKTYGVTQENMVAHAEFMGGAAVIGAAENRQTFSF